MQLKTLLALALALACGAPDDSMDAELGTLEQDISVKPLHGWRTDLAHPNKGTACQSPTTGSTTQVCNFPPNRTVTFSCGSGFTAAELTICQQLVDSEVQALINQYGPAWQFGRVTSGADFAINKQALAGASSTNILAFVNAVGGAFSTPLAESVTFNGTARLAFSQTIGVDWAKIDSTFSGGDRLRVKGHTIGMIGSWGVGLGAITGDTTRKNAITITSGTAKALNHRASDECRVDNYDPSNPTVLDAVGASCA